MICPMCAQWNIDQHNLPKHKQQFRDEVHLKPRVIGQLIYRGSPALYVDEHSAEMFFSDFLRERSLTDEQWELWKDKQHLELTKHAGNRDNTLMVCPNCVYAEREQPIGVLEK